MNRYQMGVLVMDCLQALNVDMDIVLKAINTRNLDKSFKLIQENPKITKVDFLERMGLTEE